MEISLDDPCSPAKSSGRPRLSRDREKALKSYQQQKLFHLGQLSSEIKKLERIEGELAAKATELADVNIENLVAATAEQHDFAASRQMLEVEGLCNSCRTAGESA